jgi:hypothetical protein
MSTQQTFQVCIPDDMTFADLKLARKPNGGVTFDWAVIERICQASGLPAEMFSDSPEDNLCELIVGWYQAHLQSGGEVDLVCEDLFTEVLVEEKAAQNLSHQSARA